MKRIPWHGWLGLVLVGIFWPLNWYLDGLRTYWAFTPLWLGYCLFVDGLVYARKGSSMLKRSTGRYAGLFLISVLGWWLFEVFNQRLQNWSYIGRDHFNDLEYALFASFSFSTVIPAVFGTAELISTLGWLKRSKPGPMIKANTRNTWLVFLLGWTMLALMLAWPSYFFPFMWLSVFFILEPINVWLGNRTLAKYVETRDWRPVIALWFGGLSCGFFWELWNYYSYPKWIYHIPFVDFAHIFEMPLLGYGGYLPFAMELFAMYHFLMGLLGRRGDGDFIQLD